MEFLTAAMQAAPSIISGISSLFGGGGSESTTINYKALRKAAEKGGFNPLTALRAGGSAGFMQTHTPALASVATIGRAVANGFQAAIDYDPNAEKTAEMERQLLKAQLENIQERTRKSQSFNVPTTSSPGPGRGVPGAIPPAGIDVRGKDGQILDVSNPEAPMEAESDLWRWFREGRIGPEVRKAAEANDWSVQSVWDAMNKSADDNQIWMQNMWNQILPGTTTKGGF